MKSLVLSSLLLVLLAIVFISCRGDITKTIIIDDKDDYIECMIRGLNGFKFNSYGHSGRDYTIMYSNAFSQYYNIIIKNCKELYKENVV